jgi:CrcB protein
MKFWLFVFIGGGAGSMARYGLSTLFEDYKLLGGFPVATFLANMLSSFIVGILLGFIDKTEADNSLWLLLVVGFCGGFSTFSTLSLESFKMIQNGQWLLFGTYMLLSVIFGIIMVFLGYQKNF